MIPTAHVLGLATVLFGLGLIGVILRRNLLIVLMSIELMLNAVSLMFVGFSRAHSDLEGQALTFLVIALAAAEAAVGLAIVVAVFRSRRSVYVDEINLMRR